MTEETEADYVKCKCGHYKKNHNGIGACNYCANILTNGLGMVIKRDCYCQHFEPAETLKKEAMQAKERIEMREDFLKLGKIIAISEVLKEMEGIVKKEKETHNGEANALNCWYQLKDKLTKLYNELREK
jgi:RNA polymerase-interacting CarD/CdnL/TRCF family regulator